MWALNLPFGPVPLKCHSNSFRMTHYQLSFLAQNEFTQICIKFETLKELHKRTTIRELRKIYPFIPEKPFFSSTGELFPFMYYFFYAFLWPISSQFSGFFSHCSRRATRANCRWKLWKVGINFRRTKTRQRPKAACHNSPFAAQNLFNLVRRKGWGLYYRVSERVLFAGGW